MKRVELLLHYNLRETGILISRTHQTLRNWLAISEELMMKGKKPILPTPTLINGVIHFSELDIINIKKHMLNFKKGDFKEFNTKKSNYQKLKDNNEQLTNDLSKLWGVIKNEID